MRNEALRHNRGAVSGGAADRRDRDCDPRPGSGLARRSDPRRARSRLCAWSLVPALAFCVADPAHALSQRGGFFAPIKIVASIGPGVADSGIVFPGGQLIIDGGTCIRDASIPSFWNARRISRTATSLSPPTNTASAIFPNGTSHNRNDRTTARASTSDFSICAPNQAASKSSAYEDMRIVFPERGANKFVSSFCCAPNRRLGAVISVNSTIRDCCVSIVDCCAMLMRSSTTNNNIVQAGSIGTPNTRHQNAKAWMLVENLCDTRGCSAKIANPTASAAYA